ncbi:uncharacterized protein LOC141647948 [Silene latifolia]|uniref:uncharacterized protein LOC141647948 n=1 Tax=Silene latifolia TaxID=37657 RepID=UPI003D7736FD
MRDMVTCFSEHAVKVSETTCSSYIPAATNHSISPAIQNAVVYLYKTTLILTQKQFLITVTWCRNQLGQGGLSMNFGNTDDPSNSFRLNTFSRLFRKKKGQKSFQTSDLSKIDLFWDLSSATYHTGPEPVDGYYILVNVDSQLALTLGDLAHEAATKRLKGPTPWPKTSVVSRREHYSGNTLYCTKVQFCEFGIQHDIVIRCSEDQDKIKQPVLYVSIDKRNVMKVRKLQWNFRGNQTVFIDGLLIDLMWDVHDWFFNSVSGFGVFMFKVRSGGESRLWLEEKLAQKDQDSVDFSLLLYASKNT